MSDLISRKDLMEELLAIQDVTYMSTCLSIDECKGKRWMIARAIDAVKDASTIDAVEVVHGHWKRKPHWCVACSCCGKYTHDYDGEVGLYNYCPNCGAKMDEEVSE